MRTFLTLFSLTGAISASAAVIPVVASDLSSLDGGEPLEVSSEMSSEQGPMLLPDDVVETPEPPVAVLPKPKVKVVPDVAKVITGEASWYGPGFYGNRTANGEIYRPGTMTAAHRTLPFGTKVRVTNLWNGRSAVIRINDRGPFVAHRGIDLGHGAASTLGLTGSGIAEVRLEVLR